METLLFHPKEEDKVLAYTKEGKVKLENTVFVWNLGITLLKRYKKVLIYWLVLGFMNYQLPSRESYSGLEFYLNIYCLHVQIFVFMVISVLAFSVDMDIGNIYPPA